MKTTPSFHAAAALTLMGFLALAAAAHAQIIPIVDLQTSASNDWVTATVNSARTASDTTGDYDGGGTSNDKRNVIPFNTTTQMFTSLQLPVQSSKFYGGKNNTFFNQTTTGIGVENSLRNGGGLSGVDRYLFGTSAVPGAGNTQYAAVVAVWKKEDFLNGGATNQVNITTNNAFSVQLSGQVAFTGRWLLQIGSTYYVSQESFTTDTDLVGNVFNSTGITTTTWAPINLTLNSGDLTAAPGTYGALSLNDIQSVGVYASFSGGSGGARWSLEKFSAAGTLIPEPSALAMAAIGLGALLLARRRGL